MKMSKRDLSYQATGVTELITLFAQVENTSGIFQNTHIYFLLDKKACVL